MTPNLRALVEDMVETMRHANGVGLAAPQVGVLKRLVVIECEEGELHVLINPEIVERDGEQTGYEGCLSVPGKTGIVTRPNHVKVKALNENMEPVTVEGEELLARPSGRTSLQRNGRGTLHQRGIGGDAGRGG